MDCLTLLKSNSLLPETHTLLHEKMVFLDKYTHTYMCGYYASGKGWGGCG